MSNTPPKIDALSDPGLSRWADLSADLPVELDPLDIPPIAAALRCGNRRLCRERLFEADPRGELLAAADRLPDTVWLSRRRITALVTGFEPFAEHPTNPSSEVAIALARYLGQYLAFKQEILPVQWALAEHFPAIETANLEQPLLIHLGLAADSTTIRFEECAHNLRSAEVGDDEIPLFVDGPASLSTDLPLDRLVARYNNTADNLPRGEISTDAGRYVCNALYYHSLLSVRKKRHRDSAGLSLFIHVPLLDDAAARQLGYTLGETLWSVLSTEYEL